MIFSWREKWRQISLSASRDRWLVAIAVITVFIICTMFVGLNFGIPSRSGPITLHYSTSFGIDLIGPRVRMYLIPGFGALILVINGLVAFSILQRERILSYFLLSMNLVLSVFLALAAWMIILQNHVQ